MEELSALYHAHRDSVFRFLRRRLSDQGRAEELTQQRTEALQHADERVRAIVNRALDPVVAVDGDGFMHARQPRPWW